MSELIFAEQATLMNRGADLLVAQADKIDEIGKALDPRGLALSNAEKQIAILIFKARSLRLYGGTLRHLATEVQRNNFDHLFLLPHIRTLQDVYSRLLYLTSSSIDETSQALLCIAYQLISYCSFGEQNYEDIKNSYRNFLEQAERTFPPVTEFDIRWLRDNKLQFPNNKKILTKENIHTHAPRSRGVFGADKSHEIYSYLSEQLHGNPFYYLGERHNERFWIVAMSLSTSAFLMELIDNHTLQRELPRDFRVWLRDVSSKRETFMTLWKSQQNL